MKPTYAGFAASRLRSTIGLRWLWVSLAVVLVDQASKQVASGLLLPLRPLAVMPSLNFTLTFNTGISFSLLKLPADSQRWPLAMLSIVIIGVLLRWLFRETTDRGLLLAGIAMVIGGAAGNLIDRVVSGTVIDFIQVYYGAWSFAVFNVADAAISVGVALMLLEGLRRGREIGDARAES